MQAKSLKARSADKKEKVPRSIAKKKVPASVAKNKSPYSSPKETGKKSTTKKPIKKQKIMVRVGKKVPEEAAAASKKTSAKRAAPAAAPLVRRNTTLQTRGKEEDSQFRPKSHTTGPVVAQKPEPPPADSSSKSKKRSAPLSDSGSGAPASLAKVARIELASNPEGSWIGLLPGSCLLPSQHASGGDGVSTCAAAAAGTAADAAAAHLLCSLSSGPKVAHAAQKTRVAPKARNSVGGAAAQKAPAGNASASSPGQDKGKAQADPREPNDATASGGVGGASSSNISDVRKKIASVLLIAEAPGGIEPEPCEESKKFYAYSRHGTKANRITFSRNGDRREKKVYWQAKEIEALEELVPLYRNKDTGIVSWGPLLRANADKFAVCRTDVDLKDKWRNMKKHAMKGAGIDWIGSPLPSSADSISGAGASGGAGGSASASEAAIHKAPVRGSNENYQNSHSIHFRKAAGGVRKRAKWSPEEMALLERGIKECGTHWTQILLGYNGFNHCRTSIDLKDKWRNMCKPKRSEQNAAQGAPTDDGTDIAEEEARRSVIAFPLEVKAAAADRIGHETWKSMTWVQRLHAL